MVCTSTPPTLTTPWLESGLVTYPTDISGVGHKYGTANLRICSYMISTATLRASFKAGGFQPIAHQGEPTEPWMHLALIQHSPQNNNHFVTS